MEKAIRSKFAVIFLLLPIFLPTYAFAAPFLACDPPPGTPSAIQVEITPPGGAAKIVNGSVPKDSSRKGYIVYDLGNLGVPSLSGYQFRIKWTVGANTSGWSAYYKVVP